MSDIRFTMLGIALIFAGFLILGIFGGQYMEASIQAQEFADCFDYNENVQPTSIDCNVVLQDKSALTAVIVALIGGGIVSLIKGVRGKWDQDVKPQDMVGPSNPK
ncbi:MAG: hypothetical protein FJ359_04955 [Thaumarchaeota archaeon]|nr:hypothetical protein [Nitrososphaerota archaeon]